MKDPLRARSGWSTGICFSDASTLTEEGCGIRCRPLGRSGWVTTAATSKSDDCASADRLGQASSAVPKNTIRSDDMAASQRENRPRQKKKINDGLRSKNRPEKRLQDHKMSWFS